MSIEVAAQKFLFPPPNAGFRSTKVGGFLNSKEWAETTVSFSHNHLHDLESLWWVAVWVVFYDNFSEGTPSRDRPSFTRQNAEDQLNLAQVLFPHALKNTDRLDAFQAPTSFQDACRKLSGDKMDICHGLEVLRQLLVSHYMVIEAGFPLSVDPNSSKDDIYDDFTEVFSTLKTITHGLVLDFIPQPT
jgi:hypothetical protein